MVEQDGSEPVEALGTCPNCGAEDTGPYCSACGAPFTFASRTAYGEFLDTFFRIRRIRAYLAQYLFLLRSPVERTLTWHARGDLHGALHFMQISLALSILLGASAAVFSGATGVVAAVARPLLLALSLSLGLGLHYVLARRRSADRPTFRSFLTLMALVIGLVLPISSLIIWTLRLLPQAVPLPVSMGIVAATFAINIFLLLYAVRVWIRFWRLPWWEVLGYMFAGGLLSAGAGLVFANGVCTMSPNSCPRPAPAFPQPERVDLDRYEEERYGYSVKIPEGWPRVDSLRGPDRTAGFWRLGDALHFAEVAVLVGKRSAWGVDDTSLYADSTLTSRYPNLDVHLDRSPPTRTERGWDRFIDATYWYGDIGDDLELYDGRARTILDGDWAAVVWVVYHTGEDLELNHRDRDEIVKSFRFKAP